MNAQRTTAIRRWLRWSAIVLPTMAITSAPFVRGWPAQRFLAFYVAPLLLAAPIWVQLRIGESGPAMTKMVVVDGAVILFSFLRFAFGAILPFSGHMLFLTYSVVTTSQRWYRWLALALIVETTFFKLWLWEDARSWLLGLFIGLSAAAYVRLQPISTSHPTKR
jgi:hypothetical protein